MDGVVNTGISVLLKESSFDIESMDLKDLAIKTTEMKAPESTSQKENLLREINIITESLNELLQEKNKRYGNSALEPLEGIKYTVEDGIKIRLSDKVKRIINSDELRKNDVADVLGYLVLLCVDKDWIQFKDLID